MKAVALLTMAIAAGANVSLAQTQTRSVNRNPSCANCTIVAERFLTLGSATDSVLLSSNDIPRRDARGRFYVKGTDGHNFVAFDATGSFLRAVANAGDGPQEMRELLMVIPGPGDSVFAMQKNRATVFTPDFRFARSLIFPTTFNGATLLRSGNIAYHQTRDVKAAPLQLLSSTGAVIGSLGGAPAGSAECEGCARRLVAESRDGSRIWLGMVNLYSLQQWDSAGRHLVTLTNTVDWFRQWTTEPRGEMTLGAVLLQPRLVAMVADSIDQIWTQLSLPDPNYSEARQPAGPPPPPRGSSIQAIVEAMTRSFRIVAAAATNSRIEIIDSRQARLVVSAEMPDGLALIAPGLAASMREDSDGIVHHDIYRLVVRERR